MIFSESGRLHRHPAATQEGAVTAGTAVLSLFLPNQRDAVSKEDTGLLRMNYRYLEARLSARGGCVLGQAPKFKGVGGKDSGREMRILSD